MPTRSAFQSLDPVAESLIVVLNLRIASRREGQLVQSKVQCNKIIRRLVCRVRLAPVQGAKTTLLPNQYTCIVALTNRNWCNTSVAHVDTRQLRFCVSMSVNVSTVNMHEHITRVRCLCIFCCRNVLQ